MIVGAGSDTAKEIRARVADLNDLIAVATAEGIIIDIEIIIHEHPVLSAREYPKLKILILRKSNAP